ncbi:hypothetical protein SAMN05192559_11438 [Halobacillus karajensis]|nr:hypothetical protein [Halobacillus karajensis]SEI11999.1 hypothetical protein SAMN05192559_11438 [Halobacillus karajensis]
MKRMPPLNGALRGLLMPVTNDKDEYSSPFVFMKELNLFINGSYLF